jgi:hypothetical protein
LATAAAGAAGYDSKPAVFQILMLTIAAVLTALLTLSPDAPSKKLGIDASDLSF